MENQIIDLNTEYGIVLTYQGICELLDKGKKADIVAKYNAIKVITTDSAVDVALVDISDLEGLEDGNIVKNSETLKNYISRI